MTDPKAMPFVIESKIIKHHSLAKFLEQIEDHIGEGYSVLLNDVKTYPKQVAGMFFATMTRVSKPESEQEAEVQYLVEVGLNHPLKQGGGIVGSMAGVEIGVGGLPESNAEQSTPEQEKPAQKRRTKAAQGESE
jgi:hypothetical protein